MIKHHKERHAPNQRPACSHPLTGAPRLIFQNGDADRKSLAALRVWCKQNHEVPLKLCYGGKGAEAWHAITDDPRYDLGRRERAALQSGLDSCHAFLKGRISTIVHLGSGDGVEIPIVLDTLKPGRDVAYFLVDISPSLLTYAKSTFQERGMKLAPYLIPSDIENGGSFRRQIAKQVPMDGNRLFLIVGNGGLLADHSVWRNILKTLHTGDYLLLVLETFGQSRAHQILTNYLLPSVRQLYRIGLERAAVSLRLGKFDATYDAGESELRVTVSTAKSKTSCRRSHWIVLRSYKPTYERLIANMASLGLHIHHAAYSDNTGCASLLLSKISGRTLGGCSLCEQVALGSRTKESAY